MHDMGSERAGLFSPDALPPHERGGYSQAGRGCCPLAQAWRQRVSDSAQCDFTAGDGTEWAEGGL